ncbi:MAG: sel1 repeat family protein [Bradyrhizobium sp.]|nr:MAG: sel1 repeat family protein [Bradyrhizobium sp.]
MNPHVLVWHRGPNVSLEFPQSCAWIHMRDSANRVPAKAIADDFDDAADAYRARQYRSALEVWRRLADRGDADAQYNLGCMLLRGEGAPADDTQAGVWLQKAAEQGQGDASSWAALTGKQADEEKRKSLFARNMPQASGHFTITYVATLDNGNSIRFPCADPMKDAAAKEFQLGLMYATGKMGLPQDDLQAAKWWRRAADLGQSIAQANLAYMYSMGRGVPQDLRQARLLDSKAADQGNAHAETDLGLLFERGLGDAPVDLVAAYVLYRHASDAGNDVAHEAAVALSYRLSKDQRGDAEALIARWQSGAPLPDEIRSKLPK